MCSLSLWNSQALLKKSSKFSTIKSTRVLCWFNWLKTQRGNIKSKFKRLSRIFWRIWCFLPKNIIIYKNFSHILHTISKPISTKFFCRTKNKFQVVFHKHLSQESTKIISALNSHTFKTQSCFILFYRGFYQEKLWFQLLVFLWARKKGIFSSIWRELLLLHSSSNQARIEMIIMKK